jgi:hypothetical protein
MGMFEKLKEKDRAEVEKKQKRRENIRKINIKMEEGGGRFISRN